LNGRGVKDGNQTLDDGAEEGSDMTETEVREVLDGVHAIGDLAEAAAIVADAEVALAVLEPANAILTPVVMALNVFHALESKFIAYGCAGTAYGLVNGATGQGSVDYPNGGFSLEDEETIGEKQRRWAQGVAAAREQLGNGESGTALRNKLLLSTAQHESDPSQTLDIVWKSLCQEFDIENPYATKMQLLWPNTGITERN